MIGVSASLSCLILAGPSAMPLASRIEAARARSSTSISHTALGSIRLDFKTFAPPANANGITATIEHDVGNPWLVHRILMDTDRGLYYGYDIELSKGGPSGVFLATIKALTTSAEEEFRDSRWSDFCRDCERPRPVASSAQRFPGPQSVTAGDTLAIDVLVDDRSGELITDRVTFASIHRASRSAEVAVTVMPPKDLRPELVNLQIAEVQLRVNGRAAWADASAGAGNEDTGRGSVQGDVVWTELPGRGRVFLSLVARQGYDFKKIGIVSGNRISFTIDDDQYEWISKEPIVTAGPVPPFSNVQSWYVWVLHDAGYRPVAGRSGGIGAGFDERAMNRLRR